MVLLERNKTSLLNDTFLFYFDIIILSHVHGSFQKELNYTELFSSLQIIVHKQHKNGEFVNVIVTGRINY